MNLTNRSLPVNFVFWAMLAAFALRLVGPIFLPQGLSSVAPDEQSYAELAYLMASGDSWKVWKGNTGVTWVATMSGFLVPVSSLISLGVDSLFAVRLTSNLFLLGVQLVLLFVICTSASVEARNDKIQFGSFRFWAVVVSFIPSLHLWGTVGLRDSATMFWAALFLLLIALRVDERRDLVRLVTWSLAIASILLFGFMTRPSAAILLIPCGAVIVCLNIVSRRWWVVGGLALAITLGTLGGLSVTRPEPYAPTGGVERPEVQVGNQTDQTSVFVGQVKQPQLGSWIVEKMQSAPLIRQAQSRANSGFSIENCDSLRSGMWQIVGCELSRAPEATLTVLLRPLPWLDSPVVTSNALRFAAIENIVWAFLLVVVGASMFRRSIWLEVRLGAASYFVAVVLALVYLEGNLGTAFRHKSHLLVPAAMLLAVASTKVARKGNIST